MDVISCVSASNVSIWRATAFWLPSISAAPQFSDCGLASFDCATFGSTGMIGAANLWPAPHSSIFGVMSKSCSMTTKTGSRAKPPLAY
jgi:hypothetical protein